LLDGRKLRTLKEAIAWLAKEIPKSEHGMKQVQAAAYTVTEAAENNGPMIFADGRAAGGPPSSCARAWFGAQATSLGKVRLKRDELPSGFMSLPARMLATLTSSWPSESVNVRAYSRVF
jgi:hypothetical protein